MFNQIFDAPFLIFIAKLSLAMVLGLLLGLERIYAHKTAGMRTYALVTVAAAMFTAMSVYIGATFGQFSGGFNPAFIAGDIIVGVGFLGTGLIVFRDGHVENLTTAGGLWVCAGIGIAIGFGLYREAIFVAALSFFVMGILSFVERSIRLSLYPDPQFEAELQKEEKARRPRKTKAKESMV